MKASLIQTRALIVRPGACPLRSSACMTDGLDRTSQPRLMTVPPHAPHRRRPLMPLRFISDQPMAWQGAPVRQPGHSGTGISVRAAEAPSLMAFPRNSTGRLHFAVAVGRYSRHESQE